VAAGDPEAVAIAEICDCAGVTILKYPVPLERQEPGQTMAISVIAEARKTFGREVTITALQCITETANNVPGGVNAIAIRAVAAALATNPGWLNAGERLLKAFDEIELEQEVDQANRDRHALGRPAWSVLADRIITRLDQAMETQMEGCAQ